jgi:hypothetical protein
VLSTRGPWREGGWSSCLRCSPTRSIARRMSSSGRSPGHLLTRYKAGLSRRDGGSRSAAGGRLATVLCGARVPAQVRPGRAGATVEIIGPVGEGVDCTEPRCPGPAGMFGASSWYACGSAPPRQGKHPCLQCGKGAAPVGNATRNRGDRSALVFDPHRETSGQRRVSRWCDRTGCGIHRVEGLATRDVLPSAVATDGGRLNLAPCPAPGPLLTSWFVPIAGRIFSVCGTRAGASQTAGVPIARSGGQPDPHR